MTGVPVQLKGFCIVGPVSPWDEKHRDLIELDYAKQTFSETAGGAWGIQCSVGQPSGPSYHDKGEISRRTQRWHDLGYRLRRATLTLHPVEDV